MRVWFSCSTHQGRKPARPAGSRPSKRTGWIAGLLILALAVFQPVFSAAAQTTSTVTINPTPAQIYGCGEVEVTVRAEDVEHLYGLDMILEFDPAKIVAVDLDPGRSGINIRNGGMLLDDYVVRNIANNTTGRIEFVITQLNPAPEANGDGDLAIMRFRSTGAGVAALHFNTMRLVARGGIDLNPTVTDGSITVQQAPNQTTLTSLAPAQALTGSGPLSLTANGTNFTTASQVGWNGSLLSTTRVSDSQLTAQVPAAQLTTAGTAGVTVYTPGPCGGTTPAKTFTIQNRAPTLTSFEPAFALAKGPAFTLTVNGSNFVTGATLNWGGTDYPTTVVSAGRLTVNIPQSQLQTARQVPVSVTNPAPNAGPSNTLNFSVVNAKPTAAAAQVSTPEDTPLHITLAGADENGDSLTYEVVTGSGPQNGAWSGSLPDLTYTPAGNFYGTDSFRFRVYDGALWSDPAQVDITVTPVDDPPTAGDDSYATDEDQALSVAAPGVLTNDHDQEGASLKAVLVQGPAHGTLSLNETGGFTYTPEGNYVGADSFRYKANAGSLDSPPATVSLTVKEVNDPPQAGDDAYEVDEDATLTIAAAGLLANDTDLEHDALTAVRDTQPAYGTLTLNADGSFTYKPNANYAGADSFTYHARDAGGRNSSIATVRLTVRPVPDAPVAVNDSYGTNEDQPLNFSAPGVLANDTDADSGTTLHAILATGPQHGALTLNEDGSFIYTPEANFNGSDQFTYKAQDGALDSGLATVTITVASVNDIPVAADDSYDTNEDQPLTIPAAGLLSNDGDVDHDSLTAIKVSDPQNGDLSLNANGGFTYTPDPDFNGTDTFTYRAKDAQVNSAIATVTIQVKAVDDAPRATGESYTTDEDLSLNVPASAGVLTNDTDPEGLALKAVLVSGPANGALTLSDDGSFVYTPAANYAGADSFTYKANDGRLDSPVTTVTLTIRPLADPPVALADSYTTNEDTPLTVPAPGLLGNDRDPDQGASLSAVKLSDPQHGTLDLKANGGFTYTPQANYSGEDAFTYKVSDGALQSGEATVRLTINPVDDAPVAVNDSYSTDEDLALNVPAAEGVLANDTDQEGNPLTAVRVSGPANGALTLNADGSFTYTPAANFAGSDSFTYRASGGGQDSNLATVTLTVWPESDAPVAFADSYSVDEDKVLNVPAGTGVLFNDRDQENDPLTAVLETSPAHGALTLNADGSFNYTPAADFNGSDAFTYHAKDATLSSAAATVTITVKPTNDAPVAENDAYSTGEDQPLSVPVGTGLLVNDHDLENNTLTAVPVAAPKHGTLALGTDGSFTYTPAADFNGTDTFTYKARDGQAMDGQANDGLDSNIATVTLTVNPVNDAPRAADDSYSTDEDQPLTVTTPTVLANDRDPEDDAMTAVLVTGPAHGTLTLNANGTFTYTPAGNYSGDDSFTYQAQAGGLNSASATVRLTVRPVADPPVAVADSYTTGEDQPLSVAAPGVLLNDGDPDPTPTLKAVLVTGPAHGTLSLKEDGSFTYTPAGNYVGPDSFTYKANDGALDSAAIAVSLTITPINDPPTTAPDSYTLDEDTPFSLAAPGLLVNDLDLEADPLTATLVTTPTHGTLSLSPDGSLVYTPTLNYNGADSFTYLANDGQLDGPAATVSLTVRPVNDAPQPVNDNYATDEDTPLTVEAPGLLANDLDLENDSLTSLLDVGPEHGQVTLNADGSFTYTPELDFAGVDTFTYKAKDAVLESAPATVRIYVAVENDPPALEAIGSRSVDEGHLLAFYLRARDPEGGSLAFSLLAGAPVGASLEAGEPGSAIFSWVPAEADGPGVITVTFQVSDDGVPARQASETIAITVNEVNQAPVLAHLDDRTVNEETQLTFTAAATDGDLPAQALQFSLGEGAPAGASVQAASGVFSWEPDESQGPAVYPITLNVTDGVVETSQVFRITVLEVNRSPVAVSDVYTVTQGRTLTVEAPGVLANDLEPDGNDLQAVLVSGPSHGKLVLNIDGSFVYTPNAGNVGPDAFTYMAWDGYQQSAPVTVQLDFQPIAPGTDRFKLYLPFNWRSD